MDKNTLGLGVFGGLAMLVSAMGVTFLLVLLMREVWCWYWKVNEAVGNLKMIRALLEQISQQQAAQLQIARGTAAPEPGAPTWASGVFKP